MSLLGKILNKQEVIQIEKEQTHFWNIQRTIFPSHIEEKRDHLVIDGCIYARCRIVGVPKYGVGYPRDMKPEFIDDLLKLVTKGYVVAYSYAIMPIKNSTAHQLVQRARYRNNELALEYEKKNNGQKSAEYQFIDEDLMKVAKNVHTGAEKMFQTSFVVLYWATSEKQLIEIESHINSIFTYHRIDSEIPFWQVKEVFFAAMPHPFSTAKAFVDTFSNLCAALAATRNPNNRTAETGLLFGENFKNNSELIVDMKALAAEHLTICGSTGSGKTVAMLAWALRAFSLLNKKIVFISPKDDVITDFRNVAASLGDSAKILDLGPNGQFSINPLQVLYDPETASVEDFNSHFEVLIKFASLLFEESETKNMKNYFADSLFEEYRRRGIYREDPKSWDNKVWPTLSDLRKIWIRDAADKNVSAQGLVDRSTLIDISWSYLNRSTNLDLSADFLVIDLSGIKDSLRDPMNFLAVSLLSQRFRTKAKKETLILIDEASVFLRNAQLFEFLIRTWKMGRSYKIGGWLATQEPSDFMNPAVGDLFKLNSFINVIFGHNLNDDNLETITKFYHLSEQERGILKSCAVGQGLLMIGDAKTPLYVKLSDYELACIKGKKLQKISADVDISLENHLLSELAAENKLYFDDWTNGSGAQLVQYGYVAKRVSDSFNPGMTKVWIKQDILLPGDMIENQSLLHYCTVLRIAGYLAGAGINVKVNHHDNVDIVADTKAGKIAFEIELPGSHTLNQLVKKKEFAENKYSTVYFIGTSENIDDLAVVGGSQAIQRGSTLKELLDHIIKDNRE